MAILLRIGYACPPKPGGRRWEKKNAIELAAEVLKKYPLRKLLSFSAKDFTQVKGIDAGKACTLLAAFELTKRALEVEDNS